MAFLSALTTTQRLFLAALAISVLTVYFGWLPLIAFLVQSSEQPVAAESPAEQLALLAATETPLPPAGTPVPTASRTPSPAPTASRTASPTLTPSVSPTATEQPATAAPLPAQTFTPVPVPRATATPVPPVVSAAARSLAALELDPRLRIASKTTLFTSACFGPGANPLQDRDFMAPADWSSSPDRKCIFGYAVNPADGMPAGRYSVFGGPDGQPRFYIVPPEAFAADQTNVKQLSSLHLIVDTDSGCDALGSFGVTADGVNYQCPACQFLRSGGFCPTADGLKSLVLPVNRHNILSPDQTGGAYGWVGFPTVLFRRGFSVYITGRAGYAPPRLWFESGVDTLLPSVNIRTTAEMSDRDIKAVAAGFDGLLSNTDPTRSLASLERAVASSPALLSIKSKETGALHFTAPPGSVLSSIAWTIRQVQNQGNRLFMETNLCLDMNGEETCFTGVEDFAHCAFYTPCQTGYSSLVPISGEGYVATRYFAPASAPVLRDGRLAAKFLAPDVGSVIEIEVQVRVRNPAP